MKVGKKLLSVLLAILMITSSMSVCFGTFSFTASAAMTDDTISQLKEALQSDIITKATNTDNNDGVKVTTSYGSGTGNVVNTVTLETSTYSAYIALRDIVILMDKAIKETNEWVKKDNTVDVKNPGRACTSTYHIEVELIDSLQSNGLSLTDSMKKFIQYFLRSSGAILHESAESYKNSSRWGADKTHSKVPDSYANTVIVKTTDYKGYLATKNSYTEAEATINLGYTYTLKMWELFYEYSDSGFLAKNHKCIHNMFFNSKGGFDAPSVYTAANKTGVNTELNNHAAAINAFTSVSYEDLLAKVSDGTIDKFLSDFTTAETNAKSYVGGEATYNKLFSQFATAVANQKASIASAKALQTYLPIVENYQNFIAANPNYGRFSWGENGGANNWGIFGEKGSATHAKMEADYLTFKSYYDSIAAGGSILDYFVNNGDIDMQYYHAFTDNYKVYYLNDSRNAADAFYAEHKDTFKDYTTEEQTALLSTVTGFLDAIPTYQSNVRGGELQVINAIYNEGYNYLRDMKEDLTVEVNEFVLYFAENAHKTFVDFNTKSVWAKVDEALEKRSGLNAFYETLSSARRDQLLGQLITDANHMVQGLYQLLGNRFTAEVDAAYAVYTELGKPSTVNVETFLKLNAVLLAIEVSIMNDLDGRNQGGYITSATRAKYEEMRVSIIPVCDAYRTTYGFNDYKQTYIADKTTGIYPEDRGLYTGDEVKTQPYVVDKTKMNQLIASLDKIINSDVVGGLLGGLLGVEEGQEFNLGTALSDLIKGALFSDEFINTVVQLLYPLVLNEFDKVFSTLPPTVDVTDPIKVTVDVFYEKTLWNVLNETGFALYPNLMAGTLDSKYQANIDKLNAAKMNWESVAIRDPETKKLTLEWGVAEQKEKLENGEITIEQFEDFFYDAFEDATRGILPLLAALITNVEWKPNNVSRIAYAEKNITIYNIQLQVDLQLGATPNDGYSNLLIPIYEMLGLKASEYTAASEVRGKTDISWVLETILAPIFTFVEKLGTGPVEQILSILPNLIYSTAFNMVPNLLNMLQTQVTYKANEVSLGVGQVLAGAADVYVGDMLVTDDEGALLPRSMFTGGLKSILENFGIVIPTIDQATLATLGALEKRDTQRQKYVYSGLEGTGKAYFINADKADVGYYLLTYILNAVKNEQALTDLLGGFITVKGEDGQPIKDADGKTTPDYEKIAETKATLYNDEGLNLDAIDVGDAIAAIVELANQIEYGIDEYYWYAGENNSPTGSAAADIYLNPNNDWTEAKAKYLYDNLESLLTTIFTMANLDLDSETEGVQNNIEELLGGLINGLFTNETVTALAKLLGSLSDLNALLAPKAEGEDAPEASEPETVAEGEEAAPAIDINKLIKDELGIDLSVYAPYANIAEGEVVDFGVTDAATFVTALTKLLEPIKPVVDFILGGKDLTLIDSAITLQGYNGYNNAIIPLLEALGATPAAYTDNADTLALTLNALVGVINKITTNDPTVEKDGAIYTIIDMLPGVLYYISSNALSQGIDKLLTPVYAILDTIRPIYNLNLAEMIAGIEIGEEGNKKPLGLNIKQLTWGNIIALVEELALKDIDLGTLLTDLVQVIYDICDDIQTTYTSASTLESTWKKGAYNDNFTQADLLTVVLSFVLEWATVPANAAKLDELLGTDGIIAALGDVFASVDITYGTPNWMYWFSTEEAFNAHVNGENPLPNTLYALEYPNDWTEAKAQYIAKELPSLVDMIIGLINKDKADAPATLSALLNGLIEENINEDTLNDLVAMIAGLLEGVDNNLLELAGVLLSDSETDKIDIVGLKAYKCEAEINDLSDFINELANVLDTYASGLINWLFFGDDFRFAKKSDNTDTIVINGGKGYEMGLAMILESLGCTLPAEANTKSVLGALATRVDAILANPVDEVIGLLPNLIYFLNANGAGVAVDNLLQPVYALLTKLEAFGLNINIADLLAGIEVNGEPLELDLANLSLANVVEILKKVLPGFNFAVVEDYLVNFCTGKITAGEYIYKMTAPKEDVVTIILTIALLFVTDETNAAKLDEMLNTDIISALDEVFASTPVEYIYPDYNYFDGEIDVDEGTIKVMENAITYPNDWTEEKSAEIAKNLPVLVDAVIKMISINGVKYDSLEALLNSLLSEANVFSAKTLNNLVDLIANLLANVDDQLLKFGALLNVKLVDTVDAEGNVIDKGLKSYVAPESIDTVEEFATELAYILNTYAKGIVEWLLLGDDIKLGVSDVDAKGTKLEGEDIITINGAYGYAEGLALLLEALGCENLPAADAETEDIVSGVLASLAARISDILSNDVDENGNVTKTVVDKILELLPNIVYFLNANGVAAVVNNTAGAFNALALKLKSFGLDITLDDLVNLPELMGIADKYEEGEKKIGLDNITIKSLLKAVSLMTGLDLTVLEDVLTGFALGEVKAYDSVSSLGYTAKMEFTEAKDKHDMITVLVTAALLTIVENEDNAAKLDEMLGLEPGIISALKDVFAEGTISYEKPNWDYNIADNGTVDAMKYSITYPNNWTEETALYVTEVLTSDDFDKLITGLIDANYESLGALLTDKVNVFTSANLQSIVDLLVNLLKDIDDGLLDAAGLLLDVDVVGLKNHKIPADIDTVEEFAAELAIILNAYAKGVVEWLLLGNDYRFFVKDVDEKGLPVDFIVINGAEGYANGLALLLEALGCKNLPAVYDENGEALDLDTTAVVNGVLNSLAARISEIFADPIEEVINLLPNLLYFLNTNGVAAVIDNTLAALTALLDKLEAFNIKVDINELVNLKKLMKIEDTNAKISLDNLTVEDLLEAVSYMVKDLDLTIVKNVIVNFGLVEAEAYESVSDKKAVYEAKKMGYEKDVFETHDMVTVLANLVLLAVADTGNEKFLKNLIKNDEIYDMIIALFNMEEDAMQEFSWIFISEETGGNKVGQTFSTLETSEEYEDWPLYGPFYTEEMATYIADNFGMFVDNIIYLLGLNINGVQVNTLTELINTLLDGSLYNSSNIIAIRDALAGVLANVENLEVNGQNVGKYIVNVLAKAEVADIAAVKAVNVPEFEKDREKFVASLCDVLEPLYPVLKYVLADKDIAFFAKTDESSLITLKGAEGYAYGIIPLLETLECEGILTPAEYYAAVEADGDVLLTSILTPLLNRVDEIIENPADEILAILPNLIYFINSNGLDTVVKNTLNAVFNLLAVIKPVAKIDLYELIGVDLAEINMTWLVKKLADILAKAGYEFDINAFDPIAELTVGKLEAYTSLNGKTAYRMVYAPENADGTPASGGKEELVTVVLRLLITFLMHEKNAEIIVDFLVGELGMDPAAKDYLNRLFKSIANVPTTTYIGMNQAQAVIYYLFYSADIGASELVGGFKDIGAEWGNVLNEIGGTGPDSLGGILNDLLGDDIIDSDRFAPSGLIGFFQKIINWFNKIIEWFKNLFN